MNKTPGEMPIPGLRSVVQWAQRLKMQPRLFGRFLRAFLLVALLPLVLLATWQQQQMLDEDQRAAEQALTQYADQIVQKVDDWTRLNLSLMQAAAAQPEMQSLEPSQQRQALVRLAPLLPWAYLLHTIGLDGRNLARSDGHAAEDYHDRYYVRQIREGRPYSMDVQIGRTSKRPAFIIAVPITTSQGFGGILVGASALDAVTQAVSSARLGQTGFSFVMSSEGRLIAHATEPLTEDLRDYAEHPAFLLAKTVSSSGEPRVAHYDVDGIARVASIRKTTLGWIVVAQQDLAESEAPGYYATRNALWILFIAMTLVVIAASIMARHFARPLEQLTALADHIRRGDLEGATPTASMPLAARDDEIGKLHRGMYAMRSALAELVAQLRLQRGLLHATLEHLPQGVSVVDQHLRMLAWNQRYETIFKYPKDLLEAGTPVETLIRSNAQRGLMGRADPDGEVTRRLQHLQQGVAFSSLRELPDGTVLEIRGNPIPGMGYVTSFSDITAYKRTEQELRALTETLEARVAERTRDLATAKAAAEQANRSKSRFVSAAVHDLMQPLNAARMFLSALRAPRGDFDRVELTEGIERALQAQDNILSGLLDISRLEAGTIETNERDFPLAPLLETLGREFGMLAGARGLHMRLRNTRAWVHSDEALLRRILQNFLSNALRYTKSGTILLGCRRLPGARLRIEVWDTGPGIPQAQQRAIFQEFHRLNHANSGSEGGSGLGLAIVERMGQRLGHPIELRSWLTRGSVFSVTVPVVGRVRPAKSPQISSSVVHESAMALDEGESLLVGQKVWCVDDDPIVRQASRALLERWGCEVSVYASAEEAQHASTLMAVPDLLLLDYHLQLNGASSAEIVERLVQQWGKAVPVIVVTAERSSALREQLATLGFAYLPKPVRPAALRALMTRLLG